MYGQPDGPHRMLKVIPPLLAGILLPLWGFASEPPTQPLPRLETGMHTAPIRRIAIDAAGLWAVTASDDETARVWEVATGRQISVLRPPQDAGNERNLRAVAMSPDGAEVVVAGSIGADWDEAASMYFFDRASGRLLRRLAGLPGSGVIEDLAFSPDGRWLAASFSGAPGVRLYDATHGTETGHHGDYFGDSYCVRFSPDGQRLVTTSYGGQLWLYTVESGKLALLRHRWTAGAMPTAARFSPDGRHIAVAFADETEVQVVEAEHLRQVARPGVTSSYLSSVDWTADGRSLVAAGRSPAFENLVWGVDEEMHAHYWRSDDWSSTGDVSLTSNTIMDLASLPGGGMLFATAEPSWGVINAAGQVQYRQESAIADLRGSTRLLVSADGRQVSFPYRSSERGGGGSFDIISRTLGATMPDLLAARTVAPDVVVEGWEDSIRPTVKGEPILPRYEISRSLAIAPDHQHFVLGASRSLRFFDQAGHELWHQPTPGTTWAVNIGSEGRFVVAAYSDGTIRWHRLTDGIEVLALFPHADRRRWVAWTPEGFFATSGPDAEALLGYHLNRGKEREGELISASQLRERFYQPGLISQRLDADGDAVVADAARKLGDVRELLVGLNPPPVVKLLSDAEITTDGEVAVKVHVDDRGGGIGRLIYRIDGIELAGRQAVVVTDGTESRTFSLSPGRRELTVAATNARGVESAPVRITAQVRERPARGSLHVLAVGITKYLDQDLRPGVRLAAGDAETIGRLFREQGSRRLFESVDVRVLTEEQASRAGVRTALEELAGRIAAQDTFVLYLAGHGASFDGTYHFIPWDAVHSPTTELRAGSLTNDDFRGLLAKITTAKTLVLLDTCNAGAFGRQEDAIDRLSRLSGRNTMAATPDEQTAFEGEGGHGAFTFALLEGLGGKADRNASGTVEVRELADYVEELVPKITEKSGYEQVPFISTQGISFPLASKL